MSRTTIATTLSAYLEPFPPGRTAYDTWRKARRELRALKAVAAAAEAMTDECNGWRYVINETTQDQDDRLLRALARLRSVSRAKRGTRA